MSPPVGKQGRLGLSLFLGGGRFNQSLVRRPLFGFQGLGSGRVCEGVGIRGQSFSPILITGFPYLFLLAVRIIQYATSGCSL